MRVEITADRFAELSELANRRNAPKAKHGGRMAVGFDGKTGSLLHHQLGIVGEYAAAVALGVDIDREMYGEAGDGNRGDLFIAHPDGTGMASVSVKTRRQRGWSWATGKRLEADLTANYYILVWPARREWIPGPCWMDVVGWVGVNDFLKHMKAEHYGYGPRLALEAGYFRDFPITAAKEPHESNPAE